MPVRIISFLDPESRRCPQDDHRSGVSTLPAAFKETNIMIMAIPMTDGRMANHFVKAEQLLFIDEQGNEIARQANPARESDCSGKETLIDLLNARGVGRVLVRNIGHRMLARLLASRFQVYQVTNQVQGPDGKPRLDLAAATPLLSPEQGGSSPTHESKAQDGGCGCHHHDEDDAEGESHGCCGGHGHGHGHEHEHGEGGHAHGEGHGEKQGGCGGHGHRSRCCGR